MFCTRLSSHVAVSPLLATPDPQEACPEPSCPQMQHRSLLTPISDLVGSKINILLILCRRPHAHIRGTGGPGAV